MSLGAGGKAISLIRASLLLKDVGSLFSGGPPLSVGVVPLVLGLVYLSAIQHLAKSSKSRDSLFF
jgi:hypothetical protein